jgi:predicted porin
MKKTIVAAAIAAVVAAPAAFADVKVGGFVLQEWAIDGDDTGSSEDGLETHSDVSVAVTGSEDLGNGMKAFFKVDIAGDDKSLAAGDQYVGISGDFGTVQLGAMESFTESKTVSAMNMDSADSLTVEPLGSFDSAAANGAIAYVSPNMGGATVGLACVAVESNSTTQNGSDNCDLTDMYVSYSLGALNIQASQEKMNGMALDATGVNTSSTTVKQTTNAVAATYKMGDTTLIAGWAAAENAAGIEGDDAHAKMFGVKHAMGANTIALGYTIEDFGDVSEGGNNKETTITVVDFSHNLSKQTKAYVTWQNTDVSGNVLVTASDKDVIAVGVKHSF